MKRAFLALSYGVGFSVLASLGCATGTSGDDNGGTGTTDSGPTSDATTGQTGDEGGVGLTEDATVEDAGGEDVAISVFEDTGTVTTEDTGTGEDAASTEDSGKTDEDSGSGTHDAGTDSGTPTHDAGTDSGTPTVDAGTDSGTTTHDAGTDSGTPVVDAGVDSGPPATIATGGVCGGTESCAAGDMCVGDDLVDGGQASFLCHEDCTFDGGIGTCTGSAVSSGGTSETKNIPYCLIGITSTSNYVCTIPCNPVTAAGASGCQGGLVCVYAGTTGVPELTDCEAPGGVALGGSCDDSTLAKSCGGGATCVTTGGATTGTCRDVCRVNNDNDCPGAELCNKFSGITGEMFGFCE